MTRKDFELIAVTLRKLSEHESGFCFGKPEDQEAIARWFASELAHTNKRFDHNKFIKAALPE